MAEDDKRVSIGRVKSDDSRLAFKTACKNMGEFVQKFAVAANEWGMVLRDNPTFADELTVQFVILLADGRPALRARGIIKRPEGLRSDRMALQFTAMDEPSKKILKKMLKTKAAQAEAKLKKAAPEVEAAAASTPDASPFDSQDEKPASNVSVSLEPQQQGVLENALRRMVLLDENPGEGATCAEGEKKQSNQGPIIGIDLGTTNSCCAMVKGDRGFVIPSRRGHNTIPSIVAISPTGDVLVGSAAKSQMEINPERTIYGSKRLIGRPFDSPIVREVRDRFHYNIVEGADHQAAVRIGDEILSLEQVASLILTEIRDTAQDYLGQPLDRAVITVPAFYNENQRHAVRNAGELSGFKVERIVNEPTAAALTFGVKQDEEAKSKSRTIMIYDLGGGTFDATVLDLKGDVYEVQSTGGDTFLGGVDFDTQLMDHILIEFQLNLGRMPEMDRVAYLRVLQGAEFAKRTLSSKSEAQVRLPFIGTLDGNPVDLDVTVTREMFEDLVRPLVQRTMDECESVLAQRSMTPKDIDDILLVGGQTRMPMIWEAIQALFGKEPLKGIHPDESVAIGAALLGHSLDQETAYKLVDVLPISIGVGVPGGVFRKVITAGASLPAARTYGLYTYVDNQRSMYIPVYQGESNNIDESEHLGTVELKGIPPGPAGSRMIEITFTLDPECLLQVSARDRDGDRLADVSFDTQDSMESLVEKLKSVPQTASAEPLEEEGDEKSGKKGGFWSWLKGLFGK